MGVVSKVWIVLRCSPWVLFSACDWLLCHWEPNSRFNQSVSGSLICNLFDLTCSVQPTSTHTRGVRRRASGEALVGNHLPLGTSREKQPIYTGFSSLEPSGSYCSLCFVLFLTSANGVFCLLLYLVSEVDPYRELFCQGLLSIKNGSCQVLNVAVVGLMADRQLQYN